MTPSERCGPTALLPRRTPRAEPQTPNTASHHNDAATHDPAGLEVVVRKVHIVERVAIRDDARRVIDTLRRELKKCGHVAAGACAVTSKDLDLAAHGMQDGNARDLVPCGKSDHHETAHVIEHHHSLFNGLRSTQRLEDDIDTTSPRDFPHCIGRITIERIDDISGTKLDRGGQLLGADINRNDA